MTSLAVKVTATDLSGLSAVVNLTATVIDQAYRDSLVFGQYQISTDTCGVIPGIPRNTVSSLTTVPGQTYSNLTVLNQIIVPDGALPVVLKNVEIKGPAVAPTSSDGLVRTWSASHAPLEMYDCTLKPQMPHMMRNGIMGWGFKAYRCDISNVIDGLQTFNSADPAGPLKIDVKGTWVHNLAYWPNPPDTSHSNGSHSDCWQMAGGSGVVAQYNRFEGFIDPAYGLNMEGTNHSNAAFMITPNVGQISALDISSNFIDGGAFSVNIANYGTTRLLGDIGKIDFNKFGHNQRIQGTNSNNGYTISMPSNVTCETIGNVYEDNNVAVVVRHNG